MAAFSYFNFMITEKCVEQTCRREGMPDELKVKDEKAAQLLRSIFPNRKIVIIDALAVNLGDGELYDMRI